MTLNPKPPKLDWVQIPCIILFTAFNRSIKKAISCTGRRKTKQKHVKNRSDTANSRFRILPRDLNTRRHWTTVKMKIAGTFASVLNLMKTWSRDRLIDRRCIQFAQRIDRFRACSDTVAHLPLFRRMQWIIEPIALLTLPATKLVLSAINADLCILVVCNVCNLKINRSFSYDPFILFQFFFPFS